MKKLFLGVAMMIGLISFSSAQTAAPAKPVTKKVTAVKPPVATTTQPAVKKAAATKVVTATPAKPAATTPVVLKKDGTPDKRYNNATTKAKGPVKKEGTPDMRYKKNKKA